MDLVTAEDVIRAVEVYFEGGAIAYLTRGELDAVNQRVAAAA
jgi:hypothetical protein